MYISFHTKIFMHMYPIIISTVHNIPKIVTYGLYILNVNKKIIVEIIKPHKHFL